VDDRETLDKASHFLLKEQKPFQNKGVIFKFRFTSLKNLKLGNNLNGC